MTKNLAIFLISFPAVFLISCRSKKAIVDVSLIDSLLASNRPSRTLTANDSNFLFWKNRMELMPDNFVNGPEYAAALNMRFRLKGDVRDLVTADSLYKQSNTANLETEPGIFRTLAALALQRHQFREADSLLKLAEKIDGNNMANAYLGFDVAFELGDYMRAKKLLHSIEVGNSYGYLFRRAKWEHYGGSLDSAIAYMLRAAIKAGNSQYLKQAALSNAADLYVHKGSLDKAYKLYLECIRVDASDLHSLMGIGWIALVQDKNDSLAEKIFQFARRHTSSPDPLLRLIQLAEARKEPVLQKKYALEFERQVTAGSYGRMYHKYLVTLYCGILNNPSRAVALAADEMRNRTNPQVIAWYCYALMNNNEPAKAYQLYRQFVSGKPLEGLELFYMGKLMQRMEKGFTAQEFFKAAYKNRFDLSPSNQEELEKLLE